MNNASLINQCSGKTEYYTPPFIIEAARSVMGGIDLDPASSAKANEAVKADRFYSEQESGLVRPWLGKVWMNHPFGRGTNSWWIDKLILGFDLGSIEQACCITFACTSERWFGPLLNYPQCYLSPRTNYYLPDGKLFQGVTKGSVVTYLGHNVGAFISAFSRLGHVTIPAYMAIGISEPRKRFGVMA